MNDSNWKYASELVFGLVVLVVLAVIGRFNYLLFHCLVEMFSIIVSSGVFIIGWHSRAYLKNNYLLFLALAMLFVSLVDLLHTLAYSGMGVFPGHGPNLPTQLWIVARSLQAGALLAATFFIARPLRPAPAFGVLGFVCLALVWTVFSGRFPECYIPGQGLTPFKKNAEYVLCLAMAAAGFLLWRRGSEFDPGVRRLILAFILTSIVSELAFTSYLSVSGAMNQAGHMAKLVAFYFLYRAVFVTGVASPHDLLFRDLTRATRDLQRHKTLLQGFLDSVQETALLLTSDGTVLFANKTMASRLHLAPEQVVGQKITDLFFGDLGRRRMEHIRKVIATGQELRFEDTRTGRHYLNMIYPLVRDGQVDSLAVLALDITARKQDELELRKFQASMDYSPLSVVTTDVQGIIEYVNPAFCRATGYTREEALGQNPRILKSGRHDTSFYQSMWETILAGNVWRGEVCNRRKSGELYWEEAVIFPVLDDAGKIGSLVAMKQDISYRKDLERLKEDVDRIMRHDLKAPLNAIMGLPQVLETTGGLNQEQIEIVRLIHDSGLRMLEMIDASLDLFKIEQGIYEYRPEQVDAAGVVRQVLKQHRSLIRSKSLGVEMHVDGRQACEDASYRIWSKRILLYSLLANLIVNALEASPSGELVFVRMKSGDPLEIVIENKGAVPTKVRANFFEKFNTVGKASGTGLGTYSARLMAQAMGYEIFMHTNDERNETQVGIRIPVNPPTG